MKIDLRKCDISDCHIVLFSEIYSATIICGAVVVVIVGPPMKDQQMVQFLFRTIKKLIQEF